MRTMLVGAGILTTQVYYLSKFAALQIYQNSVKYIDEVIAGYIEIAYIRITSSVNTSNTLIKNGT